MKHFMRFWAVVRRFKAFLSVGLLTFVPILNVLATWCYAGQKLDDTVTLKRRMQGNIQVGLKAFDRTTKRIWTTWLSETLVVVSFTAISVVINALAYAAWPEKLNYRWLVEWNLFHWYQLAAWSVSGYFITAALVRMLNAIYTAHRDFDPEYMDEADVTPSFLANRKKAINNRLAEEARLAAEIEALKGGVDPEASADDSLPGCDLPPVVLAPSRGGTREMI